MNTLIQILHEIGDLSLEYIWFPLILWTAVAFPLTLILQRTGVMTPVWQYHSRVALLLVLPLSIAGSYLAEVIGQALTTSSATPTKFFVIQNPLSVAAADSQTGWAASLTEPVFWIGLAGAVLATGIIYHLLRILIHSIQLKALDKQLIFTWLNDLDDNHITFTGCNVQELNPLVAFSEKIHVPFTYGFFQTKVVIPAALRENPEKLNMAIHHELMHIKHRDFLLNGLLVTIKALFWFHPLVHQLYRQAQELREITCDGQVLADKRFSRKRYAALLFELAEREHENSPLVMSMAVNPSSLKKRIQIMATQNISTTAFRSSFLLTSLAAGLLVFTISCSDITEEDGITSSELQQAQSQMADQNQQNQPLLLLNGERVTKDAPPNVISRIKSKYIESINVIKGQNAIDTYGKAGKNGIIEIRLIEGITKDAVFSDLKDEPGSFVGPTKKKKSDHFVAVEEMPELKGGLQSLVSKLKYPEKAVKAGIEGRVVVSFIVNKQGNVEDPQIIKEVGGGLDQEALRVVKQARFEPGKQQGEPVRVQYALPITFKLPDNSSNNGS